MYSEKVFIKHPNITRICVAAKKELVCVFPFLGKESLEIKKPISNHHLTLPTIFILKMCFLKNSALALFIVLSVIAATLFIMVKRNAIFTSEQLNIWDIWEFRVWNFAFDKQTS